MKELIERLRTSAPLTYATMNEAADALEQQAKQIEELSAALAAKDEALRDVQRCDYAARVEGLLERLSEQENEAGSLRDLVERRLLHMARLADEAIALQPHAALVAKIKAGALRDASDSFSDGIRGWLRNRADCIEKGEQP